MSITMDSCPQRHPDVIGRLMEGEAVIIMPEKKQVKVLNEVGARIWSLVGGERTVRRIVHLLCQEYEVSEQQMEADALEFLSQLYDEGILTLGA